VYCTDGKVHDTFELRVAEDSTSFYNSEGCAAHVVATRDIVRIEQKNYLLGAFTGGGAGLLAGVAVGVPLALLLNSTSSSEDGPALFAALVAPGLGSIVGFIYGASEGSTTVYQLRPEESSSTGATEPRKESRENNSSVVK
jgi:hypothetical protein